jgi:hypothetical protein
MNTEEQNALIEMAKYDERMRIARELRAKPFGWCSVCSNIPCQCNRG